MCDASQKITRKSQKITKMVEWLLATTAILIVITVGAAAEYYRRIRKATNEYDVAKGTVEDVVLSFNRELKRETNRLELVAYKVEGNTSRTEANQRRVEGAEKRIESLETQMGAISKKDRDVPAALAEITAKIQTAEATQEALKTQIATLYDQMQKLTVPHEIGSEPVIPIRRDKAMASLTDTEISVLELLSKEGAKTAPEIKERVQLSREHTARLMKRLYEEGYLERETRKIPFKYSVKKEMERLLNKPETSQA
jgi:chaperonin cofactor prefoldin/DNA-binding CsgD family transcriptional regulator